MVPFSDGSLAEAKVRREEMEKKSIGAASRNPFSLSSHALHQLTHPPTRS
jgi:hypothetical protein